ncbi:MAG TPA: hypothetical protein VGJ50_31370, partial [Streptosporangiaceae bacterium]
MAGGSQEDWLRTRGYLNAHRHELTRSVLELYPEDWRVAGTPMLARPEWRPAAPVPLDQVTLSWYPRGAANAAGLDGTVVDGTVVDGTVVDDPVVDGTVLDDPVLDDTVLDGTGPETSAVRPLREDGGRFACYADALGALSRPRLFEDRTCYRI